jgi:radical SAM superfamily enzyme YgiQ (UPF0313 family)
MKVELICVPSDIGHGANDGSYYPVGLLTIASHVAKCLPEINIKIIDTHHTSNFVPSADIVGISASSTLNYGKVLKMASLAKKNGAVVVLGGAHATELPEQILSNRKGIIDFIIRGKGEVAFVSLIKAIRVGQGLEEVPGLCWHNKSADTIIKNPISDISWDYEHFLPLNFKLLQPDLNSYWNNFKNTINHTYDYIFNIFTHFGCSYKDLMSKRQPKQFQVSNYCSYCSLNDKLLVRKPEKIIEEVLYLLKVNKIPIRSNILLKCYGDNLGPHFYLVKELESLISKSKAWNKYNIRWTFYMQSNFLNSRMAEALKKVGTDNLFIGFDSADERIQRINGLGTNNFTHKKCVENCVKNSINIQAALMVGCAGEDEISLKKNIEFAHYLSNLNNLERINTSICVIMPGAKNYELLKSKEQWIESQDYLDTKVLQKLWIKHFCPDLSENPETGISLLNSVVNEIDQLSPGPHSSMGYLSNLAEKQKDI